MAARDIVMGAAGASSADNTYVEDVFSTYLYTGNGSSQTITNDLDLSGKGGMVWLKSRNGTTADHAIYDTARGATFDLGSNLTTAQTTQSTGVTSFNSTGFSIGSLAKLNTSTTKYTAWSFLKKQKFFDVVTYTGDGTTTGRAISHSLGITPGMIFVKCASSTGGWKVWHTSTTDSGLLNTLTAFSTANSLSTDPRYQGYISSADLSTFTVSPGASSTVDQVNASGVTYIAYIFAHDTATDGLIQCGSYTGNGSTTGPEINLGWEPSYTLIKRTNGTGNWVIYDNMRGVAIVAADVSLSPNTASVETGPTEILSFSSIGFQLKSTGLAVNGAGSTYTYMAIRRGPMRTPTDGTKVFQPVVRQGSGAAAAVDTIITPDLVVHKLRGAAGYGSYWLDRLRDNYILYSDSTGGTAAETASTTSFPAQMWDNQTGYDIAGTSVGVNSPTYSYIDWVFKRAPGFFDIVNVSQASTDTPHNLGVVPELIIAKNRTTVADWYVFNKKDDGNGRYCIFNSTNAFSNSSNWSTDYATSSVLRTTSVSSFMGTPSIYYLFTSCPGVSKVGTYTGTGTTNSINCGFTAGARFVLIKRTDSTGAWYVWDTARGIVSGNDPYLLLNSTAAEVTTTDYIDPYSAGFELSSTAPADLNASGGTYLYLAIA